MFNSRLCNAAMSVSNDAHPIRISSIAGDFTHVYHIADLHIRRTDERAAEYAHVFAELLALLRSRAPVAENRALVVIAGDVFEDKKALDAYAETAFVGLIRDLTALAPVAIIPGNHDFQQTEPWRPDRIAHLLEVMTTCGTLPHAAAYLRATGAYRVGNVCACTASVYDTLSSTSGSGNSAQLPPFPRHDCDPDAAYTIALAHVTVRKRAQTTGGTAGVGDLTHGCSLDWFKKACHTMVLLGDEHLPRTWDEDGMLVAQPGSILAQTFGEPVQGHGVCEWDLSARTVMHFELSNPYAGVSAVRAPDGAIQFWARGRASKTNPLSAAEARSLAWFPNRPRVRLIGDVAEHDVRRALGPSITPCKFTVDPVATAEEFVRALAEAGSGRADSVENDLREYASGERMAAYLSEKEPDPAKADEMARMVLDPEKHLTLPSYEGAPTAVTDVLVKHQAGRAAGSKGNKVSCVDIALQYYGDAKPPPRVRARVTRLEAQWTGPYERIDVDFNALSLTTLVDGPNGSGKSSFLDALKLGLFGSVEEARDEFASATYRIQHRGKPAKDVCKTAVHVHMPENDDGFESGDFVVMHEFQPTRQKSGADSRQVRRAGPGGTQVTQGDKKDGEGVTKWVSARLGVPSDVSKCGVLAQSNGSSFVCMRTDRIKDDEGRQGLIERHLSLDKYMADAITVSAKGLEEARKACEAAISDKNRPDVKPRRVSTEDLVPIRDSIAGRRTARDDADSAAHTALELVGDIAAAKRAHETSPADTDTLAGFLADAEHALREAPALDDDGEGAEWMALPDTIRDLDVHLAAMASATVASNLETALGELARVEAACAAYVPPRSCADDVAQLLQASRDTLDRARDAATAVYEPRVERLPHPELDAADFGKKEYTRIDVDDLQDKIRTLGARTDPALFEEWHASETAWTDLVARVGSATPGTAQKDLTMPRRSPVCVRKRSGSRANSATTRNSPSTRRARNASPTAIFSPATLSARNWPTSEPRSRPEGALLRLTWPPSPCARRARWLRVAKTWPSAQSAGPRHGLLMRRSPSLRRGFPTCGGRRSMRRKPAARRRWRRRCGAPAR
jgi:Calcineurin-like phosphoesterase/AAA domain